MRINIISTGTLLTPIFVFRCLLITKKSKTSCFSAENYGLSDDSPSNVS